jgi:hypothetical protein
VYVFNNLKAIALDLGNRTKADRIFHWLSLPVGSILIGPYNGGTDVYHNIVSARTSKTILFNWIGMNGMGEIAESNKIRS